MALIRMWVVPNYVLLTTTSVHLVDCTCICPLQKTQHRCLCPNGRCNPPSASHPPTSTPPSTPPSTPTPLLTPTPFHPSPPSTPHPHPLPPPPPSTPFHPPPLRHAIPDITVAVKKVAQNTAVLAS